MNVPSYARLRQVHGYTKRMHRTRGPPNPIKFKNVSKSYLHADILSRSSILSF